MSAVRRVADDGLPIHAGRLRGTAVSGWLGPTDRMLHALRLAGADCDEEGRFLVRGTIADFLGAGDEVAVGEDASYLCRGERCSLAGLLNSTSYGTRVTVIGRADGEES